jgi:F-type H+-transporting ATPase subunit gamma
MANIKDLKKKIKSTKGTFKITSAMKLVSAAKLSRAQHAILSSRPYTTELNKTIKVVSALCKEYSHSYLRTNSQAEKKIFLLVISSDKGLCGGYNSQLAKEVKKFIKLHGENLEVHYVGKKVMDLTKQLVTAPKLMAFKKAEPSFDEIKNLAERIASEFEIGRYSEVYVAYNQFNSAISFTPMAKRLLPLSLDIEEAESLREEFPFDFKYDPSPEAILDNLVPQSYVSSLYTCILDATAAEHGSRMSAMDSASKNCKKAIKTLTIKMNKLRQAAITTELIEVVSGAESLNNG